MSFTDDVDLEAQIPYSDFPEFDQLAETVSSGLFDINSNIAQLETILKSLNTKHPAKSDEAKEERAVELADSTRSKFKILSEPIKSLQQWPDSLPAQRFTQQKLSREFSAALAEFQGVQRELAQWQRSSIVRAKIDIAELNDEASGGLISGSETASSQDQASLSRQEQQQQVHQSDVDYQRSLILEREEEIQGIEQGIEELNEIFTDLGTIVAEQGTIIDNIEANIYNIAGSTRDASTQLTKAARYQRNSRGRALCLMIILLVILSVVLLGIFAG